VDCCLRRRNRQNYTLKTDLIDIPAEVLETIANGHGRSMARLNGVDPKVLAADMLNPEKSLKRHATLCRYADPKEKRILEIGSGYGTNLIVWTKHFGLDVTGVEPEGEGFSETLSVSARLCELNGVPADRIKISQGEKLPFADRSFDIVYSANVLEHTNDPVAVLRESLRVLKPGGILHFEIPNFMSFFEGHYYVLMPPILWKSLLPFWVQRVCGRDPAFARTLRTEINPFWLRRSIRRLKEDFPLRTISLGEDLFRDRLSSAAFDFEQRGAESKIGSLIRLLLKLNKGNFLAEGFILLGTYYPMYLTLCKEETSG